MTYLCKISSRKNRQESKGKILGKERRSNLYRSPQYYERICINEFGRVYNILELYYQTKLDQP